MLKVKILVIIFIGLVFLIFIPRYFFSQTTTTERITITTYYPAPFGVYRELRSEWLQYNPQGSPPVNCDSAHEGATYYDSNKKNILVCDGSNWKTIQTSEFTLITSATTGNFSFYRVDSKGEDINYRDWKRLPNWTGTGIDGYCSNNNCIKVNFRRPDRGRGLYFIEWGATVDIDSNSDEYLRLQLKKGDTLIQELTVSDPNPSDPDRDGDFKEVEVSGDASIYLGLNRYSFFIRGKPTRGGKKGNKKIEAELKNAYIRIYKLSSY